MKINNKMGNHEMFVSQVIGQLFEEAFIKKWSGPEILGWEKQSHRHVCGMLR